MGWFASSRNCFAVARGTAPKRGKLLLRQAKRSVVVAVIAVQMVQPAVDQEIGMVAVRHLLVVTGLMPAATGDRRAGVGIGATDFDDVLIVVVAVRVV